MKILLYGSSGMLGEAIVEAAHAAGPEGFKGANGKAPARFSWDAKYDDALIRLEMNRFEPDVIINAAGTIPQHRVTDAGMVYMNAVLPHVIAERAAETGVPFLHVSTDCINEATLYGRSKVAGEPAGVLVVRTSFVGPRHGLWPWFVEQSRLHASVGGWRNVKWSGSTVWAVADQLVRVANLLAEGGFVDSGVTNFATERPISKWALLKTLGASIAPFTEVRPVNGPKGLDRVLKRDVLLPSFADALAERHE